MTGIPKEHRPLVRLARQHGWQVVPGKRHTRWIRPDGSTATVSSTTGSQGDRKLKNLRSQLRRAGLDC